MTKQEIDEILELHKKFLNGEKDGERANLCGTDLCGADLRGANLCCADLENANLENADLRSANFCGANLCGADLRGANLCCADLENANLENANLENANLDYSVFPLWCGGLGVHLDDRQIIQLIYHVIRNAQYSKNVSDEVKNRLLTKDIVSLANKFHRVNGCGEIKL